MQDKIIIEMKNMGHKRSYVMAG